VGKTRGPEAYNVIARPDTRAWETKRALESPISARTLFDSPNYFGSYFLGESKRQLETETTSGADTPQGIIEWISEFDAGGSADIGMVWEVAAPVSLNWGPL